MKQLTLPSYAHFTESLSDLISNDDRVIIWIYGGLIALSLVAGCLGMIAATLYCLMVSVLAIYSYQLWQKNPEYSVWGYDFHETFYMARGDKTRPDIHKMAVLLFVVMGLQRESGIIEKEFPYSNRPFLGILVPCILVSFLLAQVNAMGFKATLETAVNTHQMLPIETFLLTANVSFATFGLFLIIGVCGGWIYYQLGVMEKYWNWRESQIS